MYTQGKSIDNVYLVRERDRRRFRELLAVLSLGIPIGLFLLLFTWQNVEVIRLARQATRLQGVVEELEANNRKLALQIETKTSLEKVERNARELGLRPIDPEESVIVLEGDEAVAAVSWSRESPAR